MKVVLKAKEYADDYSIVAEAKGHKVVFYQEFGSYQGEWLMVSRDKDNYYIWSGDFGSCSGCDSLQADLIDGFSDTVSQEAIDQFSSGYTPFATVPRATAKEMVKKGTLETIFPRNLRKDFYEIEYDEAVSATSLAIKGDK